MGGDIDARADQYALAATAFHLLTGAPPYPHTNPVAVISRHLTAPQPKLSDWRPELADLDEVLSRALAKNPDDRFAQCHDFAAALTQRAHPDSDTAYRTRANPTVAAPILDAQTQPAVPVPNPKRRKQVPDSARGGDHGGGAHRRRRRRLHEAADEGGGPGTAAAWPRRPALHHDPPSSSTAPTASTTTTRSKRSTAPRMRYTPPITPLGGRFAPRADRLDASPPEPSWTPRTLRWRVHHLNRLSIGSSTAAGSPRPCSANLGNRAAWGQTDKWSPALMSSC